MKLDAIAGFRLVARDGDRLARFYVALGFEADRARHIEPPELSLLGLVGGGMRWSMQLGDARIDIDQYTQPGRPYDADASSASTCFQHFALVTDDVDASWLLVLQAGGLPISSGGPITLPASVGGVTAVKFRDPEGHPLELIRFPGRAARVRSGPGLLGIDHSAVSVADLARSEVFYAGYGLARGEATLNHGPTQAALDGLDDVQVDVVPMRPAEAKPHVELLHYRRPRPPASAPWSVADVTATRIVWRGAVPALLRDPDGHLHQVER